MGNNAALGDDYVAQKFAQSTKSVRQSTMKDDKDVLFVIADGKL